MKLKNSYNHPTNDPVFAHEKLDAYHLLLQYLELEHELSRKMGPGSAHIRDELDRAADSMMLNYGEAAGKLMGSRDRNRYLRASTASATESATAWDVAQVRRFTPVCDVKRAKALLHRIVSVLFKMMR
ncbi:MAG: four helix bundle protein [Planctomycetota bacterium]|jgi:four helix bundle protein